MQFCKRSKLAAPCQIRNERHNLQKKNPYDVEAYLQKVSQSHSLQEHLKALEKDFETISFYSRTQAVADLTGYRGFADWAEKTSMTHEHLLITVARVAFVGAGLTYGAIFSSSRGDIGLMCYAFALFDCGFVVPTVALALLKWASRRPKEAIFTSSRFWTPLLNVSLYGSIAAISVAICLLNISLLKLHFSVNQTGQVTDATLDLSFDPTPAGILALGCLGLAVVLTIMSVLLQGIANGWNSMIKDFVGRKEYSDGALEGYPLI